MSEEKTQDDFDFAKSFEDSFKEIQENTIVTAEVIQINSDIVFLDLGYKSEAKLNISEFPETPAIGEKVDVLIIKLEGKNGDPVVSKKQVDVIYQKEALHRKKKDREVCTGKVESVTRGGFIVKFDSLTGFIPYSKFDNKRIETPDEYVGKEIKFYIENVAVKKGGKRGPQEDFVGNRKAYIFEENSKLKEVFFDEAQVGDVLDGSVTRIMEYGAFVNIGPLEGLLHIKDVSWVKVKSVNDVLKAGDQIKVKVLSLDKEKKKVGLGLKQLQEEPWDIFIKKFNKDDTVKGTVTNLTNYGAFIRIIDGVEGLLHVSDMSWTKRVSKPSELLSEGQVVEVKILQIDGEKRKIDLSLKHLLTNPWDTVSDRYKVGTRITGKIKNIAYFGAFIELEEGIDALLHKDDISWTDKNIDVAAYFEGREGEEIEVKVVDCDEKERKIKVGLKQLSDDPWEDLADLQRGDSIECEIESVNEHSGLQVKISDKISVYISFNELEFGKPDKIKQGASDEYQPGTKITALVKDIDRKRSRIDLSIKDFIRSEEEKKVKEYLHEDKKDNTFTLADLMKNKENK